MESLALQAAASLAAVMHKDQKYGETEPYVLHLSSVVEVLQRFNVTDESILVAGWLHDVVEDTPMKVETLGMIFGEAVSKLVYAVTNESGKNRKERHDKTYPKMIGNPDAIRLKLADRIANVEYSLENKSKQLEMYKKEYSGFREKLFDETHKELASMWRHLDFLIGEPDGQ